uniref:hypothetical protein n=1 Tax=Serratia proteamaculans TaxID=28151 RepID=UPI001F4BE791|nr:hypothetical protein [Serratia proteamaculans]
MNTPITNALSTNPAASDRHTQERVNRIRKTALSAGNKPSVFVRYHRKKTLPYMEVKQAQLSSAPARCAVRFHIKTPDSVIDKEGDAEWHAP